MKSIREILSQVLRAENRIDDDSAQKKEEEIERERKFHAYSLKKIIVSFSPSVSFSHIPLVHTRVSFYHFYSRAPIIFQNHFSFPLVFLFSCLFLKTFTRVSAIPPYTFNALLEEKKNEEERNTDTDFLGETANFYIGIL